jgi:hypothetical protein
MATTTNFVNSSCLCMMDGIAYKKNCWIMLLMVG